MNRLTEVLAAQLREYEEAEKRGELVRVVRCKDCRYCHSGYCERFDDLIPFGVAHYEWENRYCADGKRREDTNDTQDAD